ncbi:MAG: hypothetical protein Q9202_004953 [Teloschistes flavicans]
MFRTIPCVTTSQELQALTPRPHYCSLFTLKRKGALKTSNITHVLSVVTFPLDDALFHGYQHLAIDIDDDEDADIIQHFPASNAFIREGLEGGGGVLVHCAMGKSRSATVIIAYLLSTLSIETPTTALALLRQCRPMAEPNSGFWSQLELYHRMQCPQDVLGNPQYQRWCWEREKKRSLLEQVVPGSEHIIFEDEMPETSMSEGIGQEDEGKANQKEETEEYRCRHLKDRGFCAPIIDEAEAAAKKKREDLHREMDLIKEEYEEKLKKRKKAKESTKQEKDSEKSKAKDKEISKKEEDDDNNDDEKAEKEKNDKASQPARMHFHVSRLTVCRSKPSQTEARQQRAIKDLASSAYKKASIRRGLIEYEMRRLPRGTEIASKTHHYSQLCLRVT